MAQGIIAKVFVDTSQFTKGMSTATKSAAVFSKEVSVSAETAARAQVRASVKTTEALQAQIGEYHKLAAAAETGSKEQIAAARLAADAERKLAGSFTTTRGASSKLRGESKTLGGELNRLSRGALSGSGAFSGLGRAMAFASTSFLGAAGFVALVKSSIDAASGLHEAISKTGEVFDTSSRQIDAWSKTTANSMGISSRAALETASSFGALFRPAGFSVDEAAKQAERLTKLGSDLASFYNTSVKDALDAITSGIVGQSRPLRRYGVLLDAARVSAEAMAETGKKTAKELTNQEKITARINIIFHDTALAQGDFARTSGGLANQLRIASSNIDDLKEKLGVALVPAVTHAVQAFNKWISQSKNQKQVTDEVKKAVDILTTVLHDLKHALDLVNTVTGSTKETLKLLFGVFLGFKALKFASELKLIATNIGLIGNAAATATPKVEGLAGAETAAAAGGGAGGGLRGLFAGLGIGAAATAGGALVARLGGLGASAGQIKGKSQNEALLAASGQPVQGAPGVYKIGDAYYRATGSGTEELSLRDVQLIVTKNVLKKAKRAPAVPISTDVTSGGYGGGIPVGTDKTVTRTAGQRNTFFDAMINRQLGRVQDITSVRGQVERLGQIAAEIQKRIAKTKDITRKLNLEDQLLNVQRQRKAARAQLVQDFSDSLQYNFDKAGLTKGLADDLAANQAQLDYVRRRMQVEGRTNALLEEELGLLQTRQSLEQQQAQMRSDAAKARRDAVRAAKAAAAATAAHAAQTKLDWAEFAYERAQDTKGMKDDIKALKVIIALIEQQIRTTGLTIDRARQLYQYKKALRDALHPPRTGGGGGRGGGGFSDPNMGFSGPTASIGQVGPGGRVLLPGDPGYKNIPVVPSTPAAPSGGRPIGFSSYGGVTINGGVHLHGVQNVQEFEQQLEKRAQARPQTRRGPV